jgi:hypothetical protein
MSGLPGTHESPRLLSHRLGVALAPGGGYLGAGRAATPSIREHLADHRLTIIHGFLDVFKGVLQA